MIRARRLGGALLFVMGCGEPPAADDGPTTPPDTVTETFPPPSTSTTFPIDTGFGATNNQDPDNWLFVDEMGQFTMSPSGGPYDSMSGTLMLQEYVDEFDIYEGPPCLVSWSMSGTVAPLPCAGCDAAFEVEFDLVSGNLSTCQSADLPSETLNWRLGVDATQGIVYRDIGNTGVWVAWYDGVIIGDTVTISYVASWPIFQDDEEM